MWNYFRHRGRSLGFVIAIAACHTSPAFAQVANRNEVQRSGEPVVNHAVARISDRFVNHILNRGINQWQVIQEFMLGTRTSGTASTRGRVTAQLIPSAEQAVLEIRLIGTTRCDDNVGERRAVTIYTATGAQIDARKRIVIDGSGVHALPSVANCSAQVQINDIAAQRRIVERLAWRRANRMHGQIEEAAAASVRTRTERQLDQEMADMLAQANKVVREDLNAPVLKHEEFPCRLMFNGTTQFLQATIVPAPASKDFPAIRALELSPRHDVAFGIHESCLNRICEFVLGEKELHDTAFLNMMEFLTGNSPRPLWVHDRTDRWSVIVAKQNPLTTTFANDRLTITIRIASCSRGEERLIRPLAVVATFHSEITPDGPHFIREGKVAVHFSDTDAATSQEEDFRQFIQHKFSGLFQPEIYFDGLAPPVGGSLSKLRQLELRELSFRDGWAVIAYQLPPENTQVAQVGQ